VHGEAAAVHAMGWFLINMTPIAVGVAALSTPEPRAAGPAHDIRLQDVGALLKKPDLLRLYGAQLAFALGPGWTSGIFIFFATDFMRFTPAQASTLLLFYVTSGLIGAPTVAWLATKIGKHRAVMLAAVAYSVGLMTVLSPPKGVMLWSIPVNLWCGFWGSGFELTIRSMLADVADEVRLDHGRDHLSLIYALNTASAKVATALAIVITYPILQTLGFDPKLGRGNTEGAIHGLGLTFVSGPIVCVMLGAVCMIGWRLTADRHNHIRTALEARDAAAALGLADTEHTDEAALKAGQASAA
jgi:Na+/melibiose symporter-like transporter